MSYIAANGQEITEAMIGSWCDAYERGEFPESERTVRPLALAFHPPVWLLISWCELRDDFRNFRLDRIASCDATGESFTDEPGKSLADYLRRMESEAGPPQSP